MGSEPLTLGLLSWSWVLMFKKLVSWPAVAIALAAAIVLAFVGHRESSEMARLAEHGHKAMAQIEEVHWKTKRGMERNFTLAVVFETENGTEVREEIPVDNDIGKRARDDDAFVEVEVAYLPEEPSVVRLANAKDGSAAMYAIAGLLAIIGIALGLLRLRQGRA